MTVSSPTHPGSEPVASPIRPPRASTEPLRFLFVMAAKNYLRHYGPTMSLLAERGHTVRVVYMKPDKHPDLEPVPADAPPTVAMSSLPATGRPTRWTRLAKDLRLTVDYVRFLDPRFASAEFGRRRMEEDLPPAARRLTRVKSLPPRRIEPVIRCYRALEKAIPTDPTTDELLRSEHPDVVVVSPGLRHGPAGVRQTDHIKSAGRLGIPVAVAVASWDHLTFKGLIRLEPDAVVVWNERQRREAVELHGIPPEKVLVTGAQDFDEFFDVRPTVSREEFAARVGLPAERPFLLYLGSARNIAKGDDEIAFVRRWITAIRQSADPAVAELGILVRPHPSNIDHWTAADLSDLGDVVVWPRSWPQRWFVNQQAQADKLNAFSLCVGAIGINTTAMIEVGAVGRPVFTVRAPEFAHTQEGTMHFRHLVEGRDGAVLVQVADDLPAHVEQVSAALRDDGRSRARVARFVKEFLRPHGLDHPTVPLVADALERVAVQGPTGANVGRAGHLALRPVLWPIAWRASRRARRRRS
jgi:hypothetical protein